MKCRWRKLRAWCCRYFGRSYECQCGHETKAVTMLAVDGREGATPLELCPECFGNCSSSIPSRAVEAAVRCRCGHVTAPEVTAYIDEEEYVFDFDASSPYCMRCLLNYKCRCAWCGMTILPDDGITLYVPSNPLNEMPDYTVIATSRPLTVVGCRRSNCLDLPHDHHGNWKAPGKILRVRSIEDMLIGGEAGSAPIGV